MTINVPKAPPAPTPPVMPHVELTEGGSVHIVKGKPPSMSDEQKARDYVATGNGALSKTTVNGDKKTQAATSDGNAATADRAAVRPAQKTIPTGRREQKTQTPSRSTASSDAKTARAEEPTAGTDNRAAFLTGTADNETVTTPKTAPKTTTGTKAQLADYTPPNAGHGALYWGFSIAVAIVLAVVAFKTFGKKVFLSNNDVLPPVKGDIAAENQKKRFEVRV